MKQIVFDENIVKEKAKFIKDNAIKLYFLRNDKYGENRTIEERLISILLSDKPLSECHNYNILLSVMARVDEKNFNSDPYQNYALKTLFSATRYVNSSVRKDETGRMLRDRMRTYGRYLDNYMISQGDIVMDISDEQTEFSESKVKVKRG